jgi:hypothetical protein
MSEQRRRQRNPYRPGTASYARFQKVALRRRAALSQANAARAKSPEARQRAQRRASAARVAIKKIETREQYRVNLSADDRREFGRLSIAEQDLLRQAMQQYPSGIPRDVPDPFARPRRSATWRLYYSTRAGIRLRPLA